MYETIVIGGGISGLTAALRLKRQGVDVLLIEAEKQPGGNIKTLHENGHTMETGPHSFMGSSEYTWKLVEELGLEDSVEAASPTSKNRYIFRRQKLTPLPMSLPSFVTTRLLSTRAKLRLMMEPFIPNGAKDEDTAWQFFCRRFGREAATYIMSPFISGVYAGDVNRLGARAAFTKFWQFEKDAGSMILGAFKYMRKKKKRLRKEGIQSKKGLFSFNGGLGKITETLARELTGMTHTGRPVTNISKKNGHYVVHSNAMKWEALSVIIASPPHDTADILGEILPEANEPLFNIPMAPVALIHWRVPDPDNSFPDGFGFLMPRVLKLRVLGTLFPSKLFKDRVHDGWQLLASFYGGMTDPGAMDFSDKELTQLLFNEHRKIFKKDLQDAEVLRILRYPGAIPQLMPDHPERIEKVLHDLSEKAPGVFLAGNYLTGVGIEHAVESGYRSSDASSAYLDQKLKR